MSAKRIMYFGHPVNTYNTELEKILIAKIARRFPDRVIENPNQEKHQEGYDRWKKKTGNGMGYYFFEVLPYCDTGIYLPFRDGAWGAGVFAEAKFFYEPWVWTIDADGSIRLVQLETVQVLGIKETRHRLYGPNKILLPY